MDSLESDRVKPARNILERDSAVWRVPISNVRPQSACVSELELMESNSALAVQSETGFALSKIDATLNCVHRLHALETSACSAALPAECLRGSLTQFGKLVGELGEKTSPPTSPGGKEGKREGGEGNRPKRGGKPSFPPSFGPRGERFSSGTSLQASRDVSYA